MGLLRLCSEGFVGLLLGSGGGGGALVWIWLRELSAKGDFSFGGRASPLNSKSQNPKP